MPWYPADGLITHDALMPAIPQALLFDLGGVLIDIDFDRALRAWAQHSALPFEAMKSRFKFDAAYERHERGEMVAADYFQHLADTLQLTDSAAEIERGWNAVFIREIEPTLLAVQAARQRLPCCAFSNTNATHMAAWSRQFPRVVQAFDRVFVSHQMGLRKPEPAAFAHIAQAIGVAADATLFFDDLLENVQAAQAAGLQAVWVRGPQDVADALRACGLVPD